MITETPCPSNRVNSSLCYEAFASGTPVRVPLERVQRITRPSGPRGGEPREYVRYRVPDDPLIPAGYHGATTLVRLNGTTGRVRNANYLRALPYHDAHDPDFPKIYGLRDGAESVNATLKALLWLGRAPAVGFDRNHLKLIATATMHNAAAIQPDPPTPATSGTNPVTDDATPTYPTPLPPRQRRRPKRTLHRRPSNRSP